MKQYFIENPDLPLNEREILFDVFGKRLRFFTNGGLFSCDRVDEGSVTLIENMPRVRGSLLDLGCGYGVIGVSLWAGGDVGRLVFSDVNGIALEYARRNAEINGVSAEFVHCDGFDGIVGGFDFITLNPPIHAGKEVMYRLYEGAAKHLNAGGEFYIVIQKKHGAESSIKKLREIFEGVDVVYKKKGVFVVRCYSP